MNTNTPSLSIYLETSVEAALSYANETGTYFNAYIQAQ